MLLCLCEEIFSKKNCGERAQYRDNHIYNSLFSYFDHIVYIDKAYVDLVLQAQGRVLREQETEITKAGSPRIAIVWRAGSKLADLIIPSREMAESLGRYSIKQLVKKP